jgi:hypothetical protein
MDVFESAPAAALLGITFARKVQTLSQRILLIDSNFVVGL